MLPTGYLESRATFHQLAQQLNAVTGSVACGPDRHSDIALTIDTAYLGAQDAPYLIVIASGTHGVEGYAGAACQFQFMRAYANNRHSDDIGFLLVHAVNPWGYFHDRRVTHEGVDLNRNFVADFSALSSSGYKALHQRLVASFRPMPMGLWNEMRFLQMALTKNSRTKLKAAITVGQTVCPDGLFYGGVAPTASRLAWEDIITRHVRNRSCAVLIDIHTGLGKRGAGELISYLPQDAVDFGAMSAWFDGDLKSMQSGESVTAPVEGSLAMGFDRLVPCQSYALGLEFGTRSPLAVLNAMRFDHWYHNNAASVPIQYRTRARQKMKQAFAIDGAAWHDQIIQRFAQVMARVIAGLGTSSHSLRR